MPFPNVSKILIHPAYQLHNSTYNYGITVELRPSLKQAMKHHPQFYKNNTNYMTSGDGPYTYSILCKQKHWKRKFQDIIYLEWYVYRYINIDRINIEYGTIQHIESRGWGDNNRCGFSIHLLCAELVSAPFNIYTSISNPLVLTIDLYMQFKNTCLNISWIFSLFLSKAERNSLFFILFFWCFVFYSCLLLLGFCCGEFPFNLYI